VGDIFRRYGAAYLREYGQTLTVAQHRVLRELAVCRTSVMGGHINECDQCGGQLQAYNSCGNRHCPTCRGDKRAEWYEQRASEVLPVEYLHGVFTVPGQIAQLVFDNARLIYNLLFLASAHAVLRVGRRWSGLNALMGVIAQLHPHGELINTHPHTHLLIPAGGLSLGDGRWVSLLPGTALPKRLVREEYQRTFLRRLRCAYDAGKLVLRGEHFYLRSPGAFDDWITALAVKRWVIHIKPAGGSGADTDPKEHAERVVKYLARYAGGVVMSNRRLISMEDEEVTFWYKDYRDRARRKRTGLAVFEFIRRFLTCLIPPNMTNIRHYGFFGPGNRSARLASIRQLLGVSDEAEATEEADETAESRDEVDGDTEADADQEGDPKQCPVCGKGWMVRTFDMPRPTVMDILDMPFPGQPRQRLLELGFT